MGLFSQLPVKCYKIFVVVWIGSGCGVDVNVHECVCVAEVEEVFVF